MDQEETMNVNGKTSSWKVGIKYFVNDNVKSFEKVWGGYGEIKIEHSKPYAYIAII